MVATPARPKTTWTRKPPQNKRRKEEHGWQQEIIEVLKERTCSDRENINVDMASSDSFADMAGKFVKLQVSMLKHKTDQEKASVKIISFVQELLEDEEKV